MYFIYKVVCLFLSDQNEILKKTANCQSYGNKFLFVRLTHIKVIEATNMNYLNKLL